MSCSNPQVVAQANWRGLYSKLRCIGVREFLQIIIGPVLIPISMSLVKFLSRDSVPSVNVL